MKFLHQQFIWAGILFAGLSFTGIAQGENILASLSEDEQNAVEAIALYPERERSLILEAATYPQILVRMQRIRTQTEDRFRGLLESLPEEDQKQLFNLSRYPELLGKICSGEGEKSKKEVELLAMEYPEEVRLQAIEANRHHYTTLVEIDELLKVSEKAFNDILAPYPLQVQNAYLEMVQLPEVLNILTENMSTTVLLGDIYKRQPAHLKKELDSLNLVLAEQKAKELNDWKQKLEEDPEAMAEYEAAAREFAEEQGYDASQYSQPVSQQPVTEVYIYNVWRPYPYWFGWPWWYSCECWYPYPWWYHWGYYYGPGNMVVFVGLPSYHFFHWHFYHRPHFYHYPHFTDHVIRYSTNHRNSNTAVTTVVRRWESQTRTELAADWLDNDGKRAERIKEYGRLNMDYEAETGKLAGNIPTRSEYLRQNAGKYPALKPVQREKTDAHRMTPPGQTKPRVTEMERPVPADRPKQKVIIESKPSRQKEIDRARDFHQNTWERSKTQPQRTLPAKRDIPARKEQRKVPSKRSTK